jgi:hypothetical protein
VFAFGFCLYPNLHGKAELNHFIETVPWYTQVLAQPLLPYILTAVQSEYHSSLGYSPLHWIFSITLDIFHYIGYSPLHLSSKQQIYIFMHTEVHKQILLLVGMCVCEMCYSAVHGFWLMEISNSRLGASH